MGEGQGPTGLERHHIDLAPSKGVGGGYGVSERFRGPDGRDWAKWMVPDIKEFNSIKNKELKNLVSKVAGYRDEAADERFLHEAVAKLEELFYDKKITAADEVLWGERIASRSAEVKEIGRHLEASAVAEAQGIPSPYKSLEEFRRGEEYFELNATTAKISPGFEPRFWLVINERQKDEYRVRATLMMIGYKKQMAPGTKELYMDEMRELPVELDKKAMKIIFQKEGVLAATGLYSTIIGDPKFLAYKEKFDTSLKTVLTSVVSEDQNIDKYKTEAEEDIKELRKRLKDKNIEDWKKEEINKKIEELNRKRSGLKQFYSDDKRRKTRRDLKRDYGDDILKRDIKITPANKVFELKTYKGLEGLEKELREGTPDSFYRHSQEYGTTIDRASFEVLKKAMRYWLLTEGRDLLLSDEEKQVVIDKKTGKVIKGGREEFFGNMKDQFPTEEARAKWKAEKFYELCERARDAEQIAWNFSYATNILETFDSRAFRPPGTARHSPSFFWNLHIWVPFHPQERMEQKVHRKVYPEIQVKGKRGDKKEVKSLTNLRNKAGEVEAGKEFEILDSKFENGKKWTKIQYDDASKTEGWIEEGDIKPMPVPEIEAKEEWSVLGPVLIWNMSHGGLRDKDGRFKIPDQFKILPDSFIRGPLFKSVFEGERDAGDVPISREESASFYSMLNGIGNAVLYKTDPASKANLFNRINWEDIGDNVFVPFNFDEMRWADQVVNILKNGGEGKIPVDGRDFSEAVRNLRLSTRQRRLLLTCYIGINPKAKDIRPLGDQAYIQGRISGFLTKYPNYFLEK